MGKLTDCYHKTCSTIDRVGQWFGMPLKMRAIAVLCLISTLYSIQTYAQDEPLYDEMSVFFQVQNIGGKEIAAVIRDQEVLLPIADIFEFLQIKTSLSQKMDSVSGFFLTKQSPYVIDRINYRIAFQGKTYQLKSGDLIRTETNLYLLSKYFGEIFGLDCKFSFRSLSVNMTSKLELPAMREMRLEMMRQNISKLKGDIKVDSVIKRSYPLFHYGMADWSVISTQQIGGKTDTRINLALGTVIAGGEANLYLNLNNNEKFEERDQFYYLKFVDNSRNFLRQTIFGKVAVDAISSIYNPVVGIQLTNSPTTYRRSFGTYPLSDYTNPNWVVELYVNNVMVDYKKADASGFFNFQVPLVYGNSNIKLKFYGPWGEERAKEQQIFVPFTFMPPQMLEYKISAGMVEDGNQSIFSKASLNYGLTRGITVGTGVEYLSSVNSGPVMPFATVATRPFSNVILSGELTYGVRGKAILNYQMPKDMLLEVNYTKYRSGQTAVNYNFLEERKAIFTLPLKSKNFSLYNRMTYNNIVLPGTGYSTAEWLVSGSLLGVNTNLTNYAMFMQNAKPYVYSNLSFSLRLPHGYLFMPQAQYEYSRRELISVKLGLEKYLFNNGFLSLSYENNLISKIQSAQFSFRYDLPFAQTGFTARQTNDVTTLMEMARGSLIADHKTKYVGINNRINVGKGGIVFEPFLDLNCNNKREAGEPRIRGLNIRINGGRAEESHRDTIVRVSELEPYINYLVELDANSFDNISWKIRNKTLSIAVDPNMYKLVEIPIAVVGEVSGTISQAKGGKLEGKARILINIYDKNARLAGKTLSEQDGYFSYLGLAPGDYEVRMDSAQMKKLHLISTPVSKPLTIKLSRDGDIAEGFDFVLKSTEKEIIDTTKTVIPVPETRINYSDNANKKAEKEKVVEEPKIKVQPKATSGTYLQVGAFKHEKNAQNLVKLLTDLIPYPVSIFQENGWYKVSVGPFSSKNEIENCKKLIASNHILPANKIFEVTRNKATEAIPTEKLPVALQKQPEKSANVKEKQPLAPASNVAAGQISEKQKAANQSNLPESEVSKISETHYLQVAAFTKESNARKFVKMLSSRISSPVEIRFEDGIYKVLVGGNISSEELEKVKEYLIVNKIVQEDQVHEVTKNKSDSRAASNRSSRNEPGIGKETAVWQKYYFVEIGSFKTTAKATKLVKKIENMLPYPLEITFRDNLYKVRYGSFETEAEANECIRQILAKKVTSKSNIRTDHEEIGANTTSELEKIDSNFFIQVGAFNVKDNAVNFYQFMSKKYHYPIVLMEEDGFYKVRFGPFKSMEETQKYRKMLQDEGVDCFGRSSTVDYF